MAQHARSFFALILFVSGLTSPAIAATEARVSESYGKLPLQFEANRGQTDKDVRFLSRGAGHALYLTASEAVLVLTKPDAKAQGKSVALRMSLVGAASKPLVSGLEEQPGKANYFVGRDRSKWRTNVPTYAKVQYKNVYPGIDLVYYGNQRQLEYDFVVAPGADPNKIVLGFKGARKLAIDAQGDLVLHTAGGDIRQHKPIIYQEIDGIRRDIDGGYVRKGANHVGFQVAAYDPTWPLVIDPVVLSYSTYLGGERADRGVGIAADAAGNAYVTGGTTSISFPTTSGAFQPANGAGAVGAPLDIFVTKLNAAGTAVVYSTYLGGSSNESAGGITVDDAGNAYVTGSTSSTDFPTTLGAFQPIFGGGSTFTEFGGPSDAFVTKINATGSALVYSTYLGGSADDAASGIAVDAAGNAYVAGFTVCAQTGSTPTTRCLNNFPTTPGAFDTTFALNNFGAGFVTKLSAAGSTLVYSTYLGNSVSAIAPIALDADGNAYVLSSNVTPTPGAFQTISGGGTDAGVTKLNAAGSALVYSTLLGGGGSDISSGIAVDAARNAYVTGNTASPDFPTTPGAFQRTFGGGDQFSGDAFVSKIDPTGSALVYSTYLGGARPEWGGGIAVDASGNAYVTGKTFSLDFPTTAGALQTASGGDWDAYVTILNPTGSALVYSTYFGRNSIDTGTGIAVDANGNTYVTGETGGSIPTTAGAFQTTYGGGCCDAFVAKFVDLAPPPPPTPTGTTRSEESTATQIGFWTNYGAETGTFSGGSIVASNIVASTAMFSFTGTAVSWIGVKCNVCGIAAVSVDGGMPITVDTAGPNAPGGLTSESVYSASGLAASNHTMVITVTGMSRSDGAYVAVDAFDVTAGNATPPLLPPLVLPPPPVVLPPLPPIVGL